MFRYRLLGLVCLAAVVVPAAGGASQRSHLTEWVGPMRLVSPGFGYVVGEQTNGRGGLQVRLLLFQGGRWRDATPSAFRPPAFPGDGLGVDDVAFVDRRHAWLAAFNCSMAAVELLRTSDGGRSWRALGRPSSHSCSAPATTFLSFIDARHGWMEPVSPTGPAGQLLETGDGGQSWTQIATGPTGPAGSLPCLAPIRFVSRLDGWLGRCDESRNGAFVTTDGGRRWRRAAITVRDGRYDLPWLHGQQGVEATTVGTRPVGTAGRMRAVVFSVTHDAGRVWTPRSTRPTAACSLDSYNTNLWPASVVNGRVWWIVAGRDQPTVQRTTNGGRTWTTTAAHGLPTRPCSVLSVSAAGANAAWALVSRNHIGTALYRTADGGRHWQPVNIFALEDVPRAVDFRRRSWCDRYSAATIAGSLVAGCASSV
jgi:photosystem II stability/assembly factor-like uncharacterized protein